MRTYICFIVLAAFVYVASPAAAQVPVNADERINRLEAELSKLADSSTEAAGVMLELIDAYHAEGRVFGLVRVGQNFTTAFTQHPQHAAVMLKLLDGLAAVSRNTETAAIARQFLQRYPDDKAAGRVEQVLAATLDQLEDRLRAAEAYDAVWQRHGDDDDGRRAALRAFQLYVLVNNKDSFTKAAVLGEAVLDKVAAPEFAARMGLDAVIYRQRIADYAGSNAVGQKLLRKKLPTDPAAKAYLHALLAQNDVSLGQRANAVENLRKARALTDTRDLLKRMIAESASANATGAQMQPLVDEYLKKYADQPDRFALKSYLPAAYLREKNVERAGALLKELLVEDAVSNNAALNYVQTAAVDPAKYAEVEKELRAAVAKNPAQAGALRYALAFGLYRDRVKDLDKARATVRELLAESPFNGNQQSDAIYWLLNNPEDEQAFQNDVKLVLRVRGQRPELSSLRSAPANWLQQIRTNKQLKERMQWTKEQLAAADDSPTLRLWTAADDPNNKKAHEDRRALLAKGSFEKLTDDQARLLLTKQAEYLRIYAAVAARGEAVSVYAAAVKRFPNEYPFALGYLETAVDYATPEVAKEAALALLKFDPPANNADTWRRLLLAADKNKDAALVKAAWDWIAKSQQKYGPDAVNAAYLGDVLDRYGMTAEAEAHWRQCLELTPDAYEARTCVERLLAKREGAERTKLLREALAKKRDYHGQYAAWLAADLLKAGDLDGFEKTLRDSRALQDGRGNRPWGLDDAPLQTFVEAARNDKEADEARRRRIFTVVRDMKLARSQAAATLALLELDDPAAAEPMQRLPAYQGTTLMVGNDSSDWDVLWSYAQGAMIRKDYPAAATLVTGMLANITAADAKRKQSGRDLVGQSYARMGAAGLSIDESSPIAPLLQAALYLRLGDERLAFDSYAANQKLFDENREQMPVDLILFVCENHIAAGGDENHDRAEEILRTWLLKNDASKDVDDPTKASVQLLLAKNFFKSQRYDVARSEFQTVVNRWPGTVQAVEAEFGIGESFMAQKVYDQAEQVFEKLVNSRERDVVIRAEFLRGVLANRRGDRDEARDIFKGVLDRVPSVELANQALFNLSEVYGAEQRYMDQLELLRTVGRLGRASERWHAPGLPLAIVVQDGDLGISRGHARIPVRVTTAPGGDEEIIYLYSGGAGKGLFRADLETSLGAVAKNDKVLQLSGLDVVKCDYPEEFKAEFKSVPLSDAEIHVAADARFEVAGTKIVDEKEETFSERLEREARERELRLQSAAEVRPKNQVKPGNPIYLRVDDADRDLSDDVDEVTVKLSAAGGDQVQAKLVETGPHTGVFEGIVQTGDLPAGAVATDTAIDHSPLMAIDRDPASYWLSEPDGAVPKTLSVDMKDLKTIDRVTIRSPQAAEQTAVRGEVEGSNDGRFWFRLASQPPQETTEPAAGEYGRMTRSVYDGSFERYTTWEQIIALSKNQQPIEQGPVNEISFTAPNEPEDSKIRQRPHGVLWHGKLVQPRDGAARITVAGTRTALAVDGRVELPPDVGGRHADVWLEAGTHDLTIFAATGSNAPTAGATIAREDHSATTLSLAPFTTADFDLTRPEAKPAALRPAPTLEIADGVWQAKFAPMKVRHVRFVVREYLGEAVAVSQMELADSSAEKPYIPTDADVLSLAVNDVLEIAAGDKVTAAYADELTQVASGRSQLLTSTLTATYHNALTQTIAYDFLRRSNGQVQEIRKDLVRIDPGQRLIVEITDYDMDVSAGLDKLSFQVSVNNGEPQTLEAHEIEQRPGVFTKEVDTTAEPAEGKLLVKPGDRVVCSYTDEQNTFPGHAVPREAQVYLVEPTVGKVRIVETRFVSPRPGSTQPPRVVYLPESADKPTANVAFEAPLTIEVIDPDAARDGMSTTTVQLETTAGAKIEVECVVARDPASGVAARNRKTIEEGRFIGQVIMQLGGKDGPDVVPLVAGMPRNLLGGGKLPEDQQSADEEVVVTRVLNVAGKDTITAKYVDALRPADAAAEKTAQGRLIANASLACVDRDYEHDVTQLHVGEKLFLKIVDADLDGTDERDRALVVVTTERGDREEFELEETLAHSGIFTGGILLKPQEKPTPGNASPNEPIVEAYFGDTVRVSYIDRAASTESGELELKLEVPVVVGTDGLVAAFSKTFGDETLAVETQFHIAESYFELFKSHQKLERDDEQQSDLEAGRRVLREVMEDYPNPKYVARIAYLLGQFAQELKDYDEAIDNYQLIVKQYPDSTLAPDAQYKLAQCYEERKDFDRALEEYVTLAATYPKSPLIANVMIRISVYFSEAEQYETAAQVCEKFLERFEGHEHASKMAYKIAQSYYKGEQYKRAGEAYDRFTKDFPDDQLCSLAWFWAGESYYKAGDNREAFRRFNWCRWKYPESEEAKSARGRLALPEMLQLFETEANSIDNDK